MYRQENRLNALSTKPVSTLNWPLKGGFNTGTAEPLEEFSVGSRWKVAQNPNLHTMGCTSSAHGRESKPTAACSKSAIPSVGNGHQPHFQLTPGTMRKARFLFFISSTGYVFGNFFILLMQTF